MVNLLERAGICLEDFDNTLSFESDLVNCFWFDFPSTDAFAAHRDAGDFTSFAWGEDERFPGPVLLMDGTRGDFLQARVVTGPFEEDGTEQRVVYGCLLSLRSNAEQPGTPTAEAELARLGVSVREPFAYWRGLGVLHGTSRPMVYALVEALPTGPRLTSLFRAAHESIPFRNPACLLVADLEAKAAERLREGAGQRAGFWRTFYGEAAAAGIAAAGRALGSVDAAHAAGLRDAIAACAACPAEATPIVRCKAVAELASKVASFGPTNEAANEALRAEYGKLVQAYERTATAARDGGDGFEAGLLEWLGNRSLPASVEQGTGELAGHLEALAWLGTAHGRTLLERLQLHAGLLGVHAPRALSPEFPACVRDSLAAGFLASGQDAAARALHATAAAHFLIAHSLREPKRPPPDRQGLVRVAGGEGAAAAPQDPLHRARVEGLAVLARIFPFVRTCNVTVSSWGKEVGAHEFADLLHDMPISDPQALGLDPGRGQDQLGFAENADLLVPGVPVPLLDVQVAPPTLTAVQLETSTEDRSGEVTSSSVQSNDAAVTAWLAELNELASRIDALDSGLAAARGDSVRSTGTETWTSVLHGDTHTYSLTSTFESMNSAIARIQARGRVEQFSTERERLQERLTSLRAHPPSASRVELSTRKVHCEVALQHWTIKHTNVVRIEGGAEPVTVTVETTVRRHLARNAAAPALGIEAADEWTTEERLRKDPPLGKDQGQLVVQCALRRCLALRVDALRTELAARTMPEADRAAELAWLTYFVTPTWKPDDPDSEGQGRVIALARAHW